MKILPTVSQGVPATKAFFPVNPAAKVQKPVTGVASDGAPTQSATGGGAQALPGQIDLQAFFAAWGTDSEQFDVTKDGVVDAQDLSVFLGAVTEKKTASPDQIIQNWGTPAGSADLNGDGTVDAIDLAMSLGDVQANPASQQNLADAVQKAWGSNNSQYDLNGDGSVDGFDLAMALNTPATPATLSAGDSGQLSSGATANGTEPPAEVAQAAAVVTDAVLGAKDGDGDGTLTANELKAGMAYVSSADVNNDASISREELQSKLASEFATAASTGADMKQVSAKWADALLRSDSAAVLAKNAYGNGRSDAMVTKLYDRLAASGFARTPPSNLNSLVQNLTQGMGMNDSQRMSLLRGLANRYPNGLGVSATA